MRRSSNKKANLLASILLASALLFIKLSFAQYETNWWYFGQNAGLDFNGGSPVAVTNGQLNTVEGCASVSDELGNLLFYTDGITIWNKNHIQMPNGFGLLGHSSSAQSALIIQKPGSATIYYVFTSDQGGYLGPNQGIFYSVIDISLAGGFGDVTSKNIFLNVPSCEKLTSVKHCNNNDIWIVTHDWDSDAFRTYLVTSAGVNIIPVISNVGLVANGFFSNTIGQLKSSPDGKKLASAIRSINRFELFDFDKSTGIVSNTILFPQFSGANDAYGVEFSPDGTKLYASSSQTVYQFDLCAGDNNAIGNSGVLIGTSSSVFSVNGSLQVGPDKKIYLARTNSTWLGIINNPNTSGIGCNYTENGVSLAGQNSTLGLPNFTSYYFKQSSPSFDVSFTCLNAYFNPPTNCSVATSSITSISWDFGDPYSGINNTSSSNSPIHIYTCAGIYTVTLILKYACGADTISQNVTTENCSNYNRLNAFIPTAFSPNNDGQNDILYVRGNCIQTVLLQIFNRWGEKVFETSDQNNGWSGDFRGKAMDTGVYMYKLNITLTTGEKINKNGNVSLMR